MKDSARYVKIVEWSEDDRCYVGSASGLLYGGCHRDDERAVFAELCEIVEETIGLYREAISRFPQLHLAGTSPTDCRRGDAPAALLRVGGNGEHAQPGTLTGLMPGQGALPV